MAAPAEWVATEQPPQGQERVFDETVPGYGLGGVFGTGRREAAGVRQKGREKALVETERQNRRLSGPASPGREMPAHALTCRQYSTDIIPFYYEGVVCKCNYTAHQKA